MESVAPVAVFRLIAGAVETAMFAASLAVLGKQVPQVLAGAMQAHGEIVFRDIQ